jgi:hypothetical protein
MTNFPKWKDVRDDIAAGAGGEVSTIETVARYVQAIGGHIQISAVFGDDQYILRGTVTEAA